MTNRTWRLLGTAAAFLALTTAAVGCGSDGGSSSSSTTKPSGTDAGKTINVPADYPTIQKAVDAAKKGDLVLVAEGTYNEAVDVTTPNITIRGLDRNKTILDGQFKLENGIRILDTDGVVVENMTARNYVSNGFFWTGSDYYRGSYLTAYRNGDYGVYSFQAHHGQFDHSYGSGSPDAGFYIGGCYKCDAVIDTVVSEYNGLGYSGTNSGGDLYIINSEFAHNRAGMVPNSGSYEPCYPGRANTIVGNTVHDNNYLDGPGIDASLLAQGNGILLAGSINNDVERNLVYNHDRTGIAAVPFPEDDASDTPPPASELDKTCDPQDTSGVPAKSPGFVLWPATGNKIIGNVISGSGLADIAEGTIPADAATIKALNNCFSDNEVKSTSPTNLQELAPCEGEGSGGDFAAGALDITVLVAEQPAKPDNTKLYRTQPTPPAQENMPDAAKAPAPLFKGPATPDVASIKVPQKPSN
ncbi:right-handed parallel beta-helix repeat-containing protein [Aquihabitans sp. McL0605]|uniref:right-handed parallel beta-helix repeat-containing protein n=1 Tax=Aquihabitans sp. McL0605 TaxID=3415671 RepID=UPI003CEABF72